MRFYRVFVASGALLLAAALIPVQAVAQPSGAELVKQCDIETNPGEDQRSTLTVILRDAAGNEKKNVYKRYWKDAGGEDQIVDKMMLFTQFPPDAEGTGFMRWGYLPEAGKNADQWLFLPSLNTIRRVSVRDPGDSFLGSDLSYQDISFRALDQDEHELLREETKDGETYYVVESRPKEDDPLYGKRVSWFHKTADPSNCNKTRIEYYDTRGALLKTQSLSWQKVKDAWVWDTVEVDNVRTGHSSVFQVTDVEVNVGLRDRLFSERTLRRGVR